MSSNLDATSDIYESQKLNEPKCFVSTGDPFKLCTDFIEYCNEIGIKTKKQLESDFIYSQIIVELSVLIKRGEQAKKEANRNVKILEELKQNLEDAHKKRHEIFNKILKHCKDSDFDEIQFEQRTEFLPSLIEMHHWYNEYKELYDKTYKIIIPSYYVSSLKRLKHDFDLWLSQLVIISYYGSKFDFNALRRVFKRFLFN